MGQGSLTPPGAPVLAAIGLGKIQTVDTRGVGQYSSLAFSPEGEPAISYYPSRMHGAGAPNGLKYAVYNGASWVIRIVDSAGGAGAPTSLAFSPGGQPAISYEANGDLRYALLPRGLHTEQ